MAQRHRGDQCCVKILTPWKISRRSRNPRRIETASSTLGSSTSTGWKRAQCGVLLDMGAVFIERGRADHVQLAPGQHRLQHIAGVHGAFRGACADDVVQLVNEEQNPAFGAASLRTALSRSSNSPRYFAPATSAPRSRAKTVLSRRPSGTSPLLIRCASPSTIAVFPTPAHRSAPGCSWSCGTGFGWYDGSRSRGRSPAPAAPRPPRQPGRGHTSRAPRTSPPASQR